MINDFTNLIINEIKKGDQIAGPSKLAGILSKSLVINNAFNEEDLRARYLTWWKSDAFDTGPTFVSVLSKIHKGMDAQLAIKKVHEEFGFNTAGCVQLIEQPS